MDHSTASVVLSCPRKAQYLHVLKKAEGSPSPALGFGSVWHKAHEFRAAQYGNGVDPAMLMSKAIEVSGFQDEDGEYRTQEKLLRGFQKWHDIAGPVQQMVPIKWEFPIDVQVGHAPEHLTGRVDLLAQYDNGLWLVDYKTTSRLDANWIDHYRTSNQFKWYTLGARAQYDLDIRGVIVDVYHATKGVKKGTTDEEREGDRFYSTIIEYDDETLGEAREEFIDIAYMWHKMKVDETFPKNGASCFNYNRACGFMSVCSEPPSLRAQLLETYPEYTFDPLKEGT